MHDRGFAILEAVDRVAFAHDATPSQVALAWLIARPGITAPIASATSVAQMRELLGAVELPLEPSDIETLDAASEWRETN
ncbi:MAG: aldo/keto reductase, partial [Chloroflexota bacterium]